MKAAQVAGSHVVFQFTPNGAEYLRQFLYSKAVVSHYSNQGRYNEIRKMRYWVDVVGPNDSFTVALTLKGETRDWQRYLLDYRDSIELSNLPDLLEYGLQVDDLRIDGADDNYWYHPEGFITGGRMTRTKRK